MKEKFVKITNGNGWYKYKVGEIFQFDNRCTN